jgi:pimeloyl-ACP methyl ester carboxylesterase
MVTVILPGYSVQNKEWLEETARELGIEGEIRPVYWGHWSDSQKKFDAKEKARMLNSVIGKRTVNIIAKSIGTLAASYIISDNPEKIKKVIFCGIPLNDMDEMDKAVITKALITVPAEFIRCFQNADDPHASYEEAKHFYKSVGSEIEVISKDRADHNYFYTDKFKKFLLE